MSPLQWESKVQIALDVASRVFRLGADSKSAPSQARVAGQHEWGILRANPLAEGRWPEAVLDIAELRLRGRIDLLEITQETVIVRDLKTGRVEDEEGEILPAIAVQLRLYGLMARRTYPGRVVRLVIDRATEVELPFDPVVEDETETRLLAWLAELPSGATLDAERLAVAGEWCSKCPFRHICPTYAAVAPSWWRDGSAFKTPADTWGEVLGHEDKSGQTVSVSLRDAAGRAVRVSGLDAHAERTFTDGEHIAFFNLRSTPAKRVKDRWLHPRNFFLSEPGNPRARAWAALVLRDGP